MPGDAKFIHVAAEALGRRQHVGRGTVPRLAIICHSVHIKVDGSLDTPPQDYPNDICSEQVNQCLPAIWGWCGCAGGTKNQAQSTTFTLLMFSRTHWGLTRTCCILVRIRGLEVERLDGFAESQTQQRPLCLASNNISYYLCKKPSTHATFLT